MNVILAIIADGGRSIVVINREKAELIFFSFSLLILLKPFDGNLGQPISQMLPGVGYAHPTKPCRWRGKRLHHGGGVCEQCVSGVSKSLPSGSFFSLQNGLSC